MSIDYDPSTACPKCGETVRYAPGRRKCARCARWCHAGCSLNGGGSQYRASTCLPCARRNPGNLFDRMARTLNYYKRPGRLPAGKLDSLKLVLWSAYFGQDEEEMSVALGIGRDRVAAMAARLRDSEVWLPDGVFAVDSDIDMDDTNAFATFLVLISCVAEGKVMRERASTGGPALPGPGAQK